MQNNESCWEAAALAHFIYESVIAYSTPSYSTGYGTPSLCCKLGVTVALFWIFDNISLDFNLFAFYDLFRRVNQSHRSFYFLIYRTLGGHDITIVYHTLNKIIFQI